MYDINEIIDRLEDQQHVAPSDDTTYAELYEGEQA